MQIRLVAGFRYPGLRLASRGSWISTSGTRPAGVFRGGEKFVTIVGMGYGSIHSVNVTGDVFDVAGTVATGTRITLVGTVSNSLSAAEWAYSFIELSR